MKAGMIRKQVYIEQRHERMLKRRAGQRGVTEAELIREALDSAETSVVTSRRRDADPSAGRMAIAFMRSLSAERRPVRHSRTWTRESLYEDRIGRWAKS
jgi:hypothetical protein